MSLYSCYKLQKLSGSKKWVLNFGPSVSRQTNARRRGKSSSQTVCLPLNAHALVVCHIYFLSPYSCVLIESVVTRVNTDTTQNFIPEDPDGSVQDSESYVQCSRYPPNACWQNILYTAETALQPAHLTPAKASCPSDCAHRHSSRPCFIRVNHNHARAPLKQSCSARST